MSSSSASASASASTTLNSKTSKSKLQETTKVDMFSYYSNDARRMRKLMLKEDEDFDMAPLRASILGTEAPKNIVADNQDEYDDIFNCEIHAKKRRRSGNSRPVNVQERKTRLSFEIHPSLMLYDMLLEEGTAAGAPSNLVETEDEKKESSKN